MVSRRKIDHLTARITEYRLWRHIRRAEQLKALEAYVALELKGLKGEAIKAAGNIDRLTSAYRKFNTAAPAHALDVEGLTPQIEGLAEDLAFAAQVLGNSVAGSNGSGEVKEPTKVPPATFTPDPPPVIQPRPTAQEMAFGRDVADPAPSHQPGS